MTTERSLAKFCRMKAGDAKLVIADMTHDSNLRNSSNSPSAGVS